MVNIDRQCGRIVGFSVTRVSRKSLFLGPLYPSIFMHEQDTDVK